MPRPLAACFFTSCEELPPLMPQFRDATAFDQNLNRWDVRDVTSFSKMARRAPSARLSRTPSPSLAMIQHERATLSLYHSTAATHCITARPRRVRHA